jgi:hypothetical protein
MNGEVNFKNDCNAQTKLNKIIQRYSFVFQSGNLFDICDWFPFCLEYNISLDAKTEEVLIGKAVKLNDPLIWANLLLYSKYYEPFFNEMEAKVESIVEGQMSRISEKEPFLQIEIWYVLIFHNCPYMSVALRDRMNGLINQVSTDNSKKLGKDPSKPSLIAIKLVCDFLQLQSTGGNKPAESFFNWKGESDFSEQITYRTYQRTIFKRYHKSKYGLYASLD